MGLMDRLFGKAAEAPRVPTEAERMLARDKELQARRLQREIADSPHRLTTPLPAPGADKNVPILPASKGPKDDDLLARGPLSGRVEHQPTPMSARGLPDLNEPHTAEEMARIDRAIGMPTELRAASETDSITTVNRGGGLMSRAGVVVEDLNKQVPATEESWSARKAREAREAAAREEGERLAA